MYCRTCGNNILENQMSCSKCGTKKGEGVKFCDKCGQHTSEKNEHCKNCGAKLNTVVPKKVLQERAVDLKQSAKKAQKTVNILKYISIGSLVFMVLLILIFVLRPRPENIPDARKADEFTKVGDTYYYDSSYISSDVAEYWAQSRALIGYIICLFFTFVVTQISKLVWKKKYKRLVSSFKEVKNAL